MSRYIPQPCDKDPVELESLADFHVSKDNERTASILRAYADTLRQQAGRVDEGMVERACAAFDTTGYGLLGSDSRADFKANMRAALTAALGQGGGMNADVEKAILEVRGDLLDKAIERAERAEALLREAEAELRGACLSRESARISQAIRAHLGAEQ